MSHSHLEGHRESVVGFWYVGSKMMATWEAAIVQLRLKQSDYEQTRGMVGTRGTGMYSDNMKQTRCIVGVCWVLGKRCRVVWCALILSEDEMKLTLCTGSSFRVHFLQQQCLMGGSIQVARALCIDAP